MPLDKIEARKMVNNWERAYGRSAHAEFIGKMASQLKDALDVLDAAAMETQRAMNDTARLQRDLDEEKTHYRKLRETSAHVETMVAVLKDISKNSKGASKKAQELISAMGMDEPVAAPANVVVP